MQILGLEPLALGIVFPPSSWSENGSSWTLFNAPGWGGGWGGVGWGWGWVAPGPRSTHLGTVT